MSEQTPVDSGYRPGDIVNGHVLAGSGEWVPVQSAPVSGAPTPEPASPSAGPPQRRGGGGAIVLAVLGIVAILLAVAQFNGSSGETSGNTADRASSGGDALEPAADPADDDATVVDAGEPFVEITPQEWEAIARDRTHMKANASSCSPR